MHHVCMVIIKHIARRVRINRIRVANSARGQLNGEMNIYLSPLFAPENSISRDGFGSPAPRQLALLQAQAQSGAYLRDSSRFPRRCPFIHLNRHTPSGQSRVYWVAQLRTDGAHCRASKPQGIVPNRCLPWQVTMDQFNVFTSVFKKRNLNNAFKPSSTYTM